MKLSYELFKNVFTWTNNQIPVLSIENKQLFREFIKDIKYLDSNNSKRLYFLFDNDKEVKNTHFIEVPVSLVFNNTKTNRYLANLLTEAFNDEYELRIDIENRFRKIIFDLFSKTNLQIDMREHMDLKQLIKLFQIKIVDDSDTDIGSLINYIELIDTVGSNTLFVFLELKRYFSAKEINELYRYCVNNEIGIFLIEHEHEKLEREKIFIVDEDLCEIF